jgi:hypothetical protein
MQACSKPVSLCVFLLLPGLLQCGVANEASQRRAETDGLAAEPPRNGDLGEPEEDEPAVEPLEPASSAPSGTVPGETLPGEISIDWEIDGSVVAARAAGILNVAAAQLAPGSHTIVAHAYDNASEDLVRNRSGKCPGSVTGRYCHATGWLNSSQRVEWTVDVP